MRPRRAGLQKLLVPVTLVAALTCGAASRLLGNCGPFTDVAADGFCTFVLEIFYLGITTGTSPTTFDPSSNVTRLQMAAFLSRSVDGVLKRGSRRAALGQFWTPGNETVLGRTTVGNTPRLVESDGADLWVSNFFDASVSRVRASDGKLLETWTGATVPGGVLAAMGRIFVTGDSAPGKLYRIDPSQPAGAVTIVASNLGMEPFRVAFDGRRIWTANIEGSISIVTPEATIPWTVTTVTTATTGFFYPADVFYDGVNVWVTGSANDGGKLLKIDDSGGVLQTVSVGFNPTLSAFDSANIWVPNLDSASVTVVRASTGAVLQTLTGNGLITPFAVAFDGQRVLVTDSGNNRLSLWKAADLTPLGFVVAGAGTNPGGVCSDGVNFWIAMQGTNQLVRF